jgi:putative FmdB family regulatory protein
MPIYEYQPINTCLGKCGGKLEIFAKLSDPELTICPQCGAAIRQLISAPTVISGQAHLQKEEHFSKRGFTQYKKAGGGVYEKTAGDGPQFISDDGGPTSVD